MSANPQCTADDSIPLAEIDSELSRQLREAQSGSEVPRLRARLSNLVIFCNKSEQAETVTQALPQIVAVHPARVLFLVGETAPEAPLKASLNVWSQLGGKQNICSEQVTLRAGGIHVDQLPFAVRELLIGDLPTNLWWAAPVPPPTAGHFLYDLTEHAQQVIYDSIGWTEPARGVVATSAWLAKTERTAGDGPWRVVADLNWRRLKFWRRMLSQALDPNTAPGTLESITEVLVEHGPHAVIQAWELVSWLASRLGWTVQLGKVQPGVEITWQVVAPHGMLRVRIRRLSDGPSEVRKVRISCNIDGKPHALNIAVEKGMRLAVVLEGLETAPRTVAVQPATLSELVVHQLSNRERDAAFRESMAVAEVFARTVLD
ncbi:MAG TPA: glucose-6-phosphate dehydrogenase assembly protein OpcA [Gemmataceae bacterium]|nr:glucose-6-phosphate dehydrogenase assembly protein OpcA [Gemmataceae bacterium]